MFRTRLATALTGLALATGSLVALGGVGATGSVATAAAPHASHATPSYCMFVFCPIMK